MRDTPPSNQDGRFGYEPVEISNFETGQRAPGVLDEDTAQKLGRDCYEASTSWINSSKRGRWNDSLRAFQNLHASGSKYLSREWAYRSRLYRPKTRAMVRKAEAQTASAFFSNEDIVSIQAEDDDDPMQLASAEIMRELLQYRCTKTIPWFLTLVGARQDAEVMGICIGKAYWQYEERYSHTEERPRLDPISGMPMTDLQGQPVFDSFDIMEKVKDQPAVDLIAPENFRFDPGADWRNPVGTSPYLIELIPMYLEDIREKMRQGEWRPVSDNALFSSSDLDDDPTRRSRESGRVPGKDADSWRPRDYDICWVRENIVRWHGRDWHYLSVGGAGELLTAPRPLKEVHLHGERPYVTGFVVVETHKTYPSGKVELVQDLQRAANEDWNLRFDNVKMALNPRQFVRAGVAQDLHDLRTFAPGKTVIVNGKPGEPLNADIVWDRPPDVTASAYAEQDRINLDFDELVGDFSNSSVQASQLQQQSATGMHLMSGQASGMNEYELRVFAETFAEPMLRLLIKLEQAYETDPVILAIAGKRAQLLQRFGIDEITDQLLQQELTTRVNVGIGATNPQMKLRNFMSGAHILGSIFGPAAAMGANFQEVAKEVFGMLGYKDGERFFKPGYDPRVAMLQQQLAKAQKGQHAGPAQAPPDPTRLEAARIQAQSRIAERQIQARSAEQVAQIGLQKDLSAEQAETWRTLFQAHHDAERDDVARAERAMHPALAGVRGL